MLGLVETQFASPRKPDPGNRAPPLFLDLRTLDALSPKRRDLGLQVGADEEEFVPVIQLGGMNRHFCRREREDQPSAAGVHR